MWNVEYVLLLLLLLLFILQGFLKIVLKENPIYINSIVFIVGASHRKS